MGYVLSKFCTIFKFLLYTCHVCAYYVYDTYSWQCVLSICVTPDDTSVIHNVSILRRIVCIPAVINKACFSYSTTLQISMACFHITSFVLKCKQGYSFVVPMLAATEIL